jgi:hypothetical protein
MKNGSACCIQKQLLKVWCAVSIVKCGQVNHAECCKKNSDMFVIFVQTKIFLSFVKVLRSGGNVICSSLVSPKYLYFCIVALFLACTLVTCFTIIYNRRVMQHKKPVLQIALFADIWFFHSLNLT